MFRGEGITHIHNKYNLSKSGLSLGWDFFIYSAECNVYNSSPVASAPTSVMAVQEGLTSIRVSWSPPTPLGDTTGYRIYYSGGSSGSEDVSGGSTNNLLLTNLVMETSYTISIVATSQHFFSDASTQDVTLSEIYTY